MPLEELKNLTKVIGAKQVKKAIVQGIVDKVYIACDAEPHIIEPIKELCQQHEVVIQLIDTMETLGQSCGIEVGSATVAILND